MDAASLFRSALAAGVICVFEAHLPSIVVVSVDVQDLLALNTQHATVSQLCVLRERDQDGSTYPDSTHSVNPVQSC